MKILKFNKINFGIISVILFIFLQPIKITAQAKKQYKIVLDAGHGGKDPGNLGNGYREKKIVLSVVLAIGKELEGNENIKIIYTRKTDRFVELHNRARIANSNNADLFVSVHCDAFRKERAHGAGTFVLGLSGNNENLEIAKRENAVILLEENYEQNYDYDPNSPESVIGLSVLQEENLDASLAFAGLVQNKFVKAKRFGRSVKQANFLVLRETVMPSVLIELGFLTNKAEGRFLNTRAGQIKMAKAVARAIEKYVNQLKMNTVGQPKPELVAENIAKKTNVKKPIKKEVPTHKKEEKIKKEKIKVKEKPIVQSPPKKKTPVKIAKKEEKQQKEKPKKPKKVKVTKVEVPKKKVAKPAYIEFGVQIAASRRFIPIRPHNFKGVKGIEMKEIDDYFKYYYGFSSDFQTVREILLEARKKGFKDAFVVAFKNGINIPLKEALRLR